MSEEVPVKCKAQGCDVLFIKKTHNQIYHDDLCCRNQTNARIMQKYYEKKAQRQGKVRYCKKCNETKLSRYNNGQICSACESKSELLTNNSVVDMLMSASIQS